LSALHEEPTAIPRGNPRESTKKVVEQLKKVMI
jgi:hypothetical protein